MSSVFFPPGFPFAFQFKDGLNNLTFRGQGISTSGAGQQTIFTIPIVANALQFDGQTFFLYIAGNFNGAGGNKRLLVQISANTVFDLTAAHSNQNFSFWLSVTRLGANIFTDAILFAHNFGTGTPATVSQGTALFAITFGNTNNIIVIGDCTNPADSIQAIPGIASLL